MLVKLSTQPWSYCIHNNHSEQVILIGLMSLHSSLIYLQFHPIAYLTKLLIEMNMADLIIKVVRATNPPGTLEDYERKKSLQFSKSGIRGSVLRFNSAALPPVYHSGHTGRNCANFDVELGGIRRTTETRVVFIDRSCEELSPC